MTTILAMWISGDFSGNLSNPAAQPLRNVGNHPTPGTLNDTLSGLCLDTEEILPSLALPEADSQARLPFCSPNDVDKLLCWCGRQKVTRPYTHVSQLGVLSLWSPRCNDSHLTTHQQASQIDTSDNQLDRVLCFSLFLENHKHHLLSMRRFLSNMVSRARQFAPLGEGATASTPLPKLKVGRALAFGPSPL